MHRAEAAGFLLLQKVFVSLGLAMVLLECILERVWMHWVGCLRVADAWAARGRCVPGMVGVVLLCSNHLGESMLTTRITVCVT
jgi:hypothetical protein